MSIELDNQNNHQAEIGKTVKQSAQKPPKNRKKPYKSERSPMLPFIVLIVVTVILATLLFNVWLWGNRQQLLVTQAIGDVRYLSQLIVLKSERVLGNDDKLLGDIEKRRNQLKDALAIIQTTHPDKAQVSALVAEWQLQDKAAAKLIKDVKPRTQAENHAQHIISEMTQIQGHYQTILKQMQDTKYPETQLAVAQRQIALSQRVLEAVKQYQNGNVAPNKLASMLSPELQVFGEQLQGQLSGSTERQIQQIYHPDIKLALEQIQSQLKNTSRAFNSLAVSNAESRPTRDQLVQQVSASSDRVLAILDSLAISTKPMWLIFVPWMLLLVVFILIYSAYKLVIFRYRREQKRVEQIQSEYTRNQNAILRLLDEISDLADGDLRSHATVTADFTGAIADAINSAIDNLRDLVTRIHSTSEEVTKYSAETQLLTMNLSEASTHHAQEIANASEAIHMIAGSIDLVSLNAAESAEVAKRSVDIAQTGVEVVNRTIQGMDTIREQIQQTSKRIKRLGESSQEIGHIVSLINDIADQTNILALNAAIQASMAGEAGRGFAVVADEVQRLAERSAVATQQIEQLVKTIQNDTNEAVNSMELTTSEVVRGTTLAQDAGVTLGEIQNVSGTLANLIGNISSNAHQQSLTAGQISSTMNVVQNITDRTTISTMDAARSVTELANMAKDLRESVSGFKLPAEV